MIRPPRTNVAHLRAVPKPYDHETEDEVWVALTPLEWSVIRAAVERSGVVAAQEPMKRAGDQVIATQIARIQADIRDAEYDLEGA